MIEETVLRYSEQLEKVGIDSTLLEHPDLKEASEVLEYLHLLLSDSLPTLILKADSDFVAVVFRGDCRVDFKKVKKYLGVGDLRMATREEFVELTGLPVGAARVYAPEVSRTLIDRRVMEKDYLVGGSGSFRCSVRYATVDLVKIPKSEIVDLAVLEENSLRKKRILTGDTPTGKLHLGHWVGTLENRVKLQDEYDEFIILADTHALATPSFSNLDYAKVQGFTLQILLDNISVGLDPKKVTFFVESGVPEIYELAALFSMYVSHNRALRNPTIKDEIKIKGLGDQFSLGFINYPMYQAADILCVKGEVVPVGQDQEAHLEQAREIASLFNKIAMKKIFPEPQAKIGRIGKLIGTDGNPKMSKSLGNTIFLSDSPEEVEKKVKTMYTDPKRIHATDPGTVEGNPVFIYLDLFGSADDTRKIEDYKALYRKGQVGDVEVKKYLIEVLNTFLEPTRKRRAAYDNPEILRAILEEGTKKVRKEAQRTLWEVKEALQLINFNF